MIGSVGFNELLWIGLFVLLLLFGSRKLPELAKALGRATGEFQKGKIEVDRELREASLAARSLGLDPEREKLERTARALDISTEGKTSQQLKEEISKAINP